MGNNIMLLMEIIGTIAFAISGALIAISSNLDLFGVIFIGCITSVGGGMVRDVFLGKYPPTIFYNTKILFISATTAIIVFIIAYINAKRFNSFKEKIERINNIFDAVGLAAFSVTGAEIAFGSGYEDHALFVVLMGMITGVGGGMFRDVLADKAPYVLKKQIYAVASIFGSLIYYLFTYYLNNKVVGTVIALVSVFSIRMFATKFHWKLPKVEINK